MSKQVYDQASNHSFPVPALNRKSKYFSRLSARSALYTDLSLLLEGLETAHSASDYRSLVLTENRLSRSSNSARVKIWKELRSRYILDQDHALFAAFWSEWVRCASEPEHALTAYILFALNDRLVADIGVYWLYPYLHQSPSEIRVEDVESFIEKSAVEHPEIGTWSAETKLRIARHYMASIRDFGLAKGKLRKTTVRPALYPAPVRLIIRATRLAGFNPGEIISSNVFRLLALDGTAVIDALAELNRTGDLRFKIQADVVEIGLGEIDERKV